jgi:hypothetical protein
MLAKELVSNGGDGTEGKDKVKVLVGLSMYLMVAVFR